MHTTTDEAFVYSWTCVCSRMAAVITGCVARAKLVSLAACRLHSDDFGCCAAKETGRLVHQEGAQQHKSLVA